MQEIKLSGSVSVYVHNSVIMDAEIAPFAMFSNSIVHYIEFSIESTVTVKRGIAHIDKEVKAVYGRTTYADGGPVEGYKHVKMSPEELAIYEAYVLRECPELFGE